MVEIRILTDDDQPALESFLLPKVETSMFLLGNSRKAGLVDRGQTLQGTYAAAFEGESIVGVMSHVWNGGLLPQAPVQHLDALWRAAVGASGRPVQGFVGPYSQAVALAEIFRVAASDFRVNSKEILFRLHLKDLVEPQALSTGEVSARLATSADEDLLSQWRVAYMIEALGETDSPQLRNDMRANVRQYTQSQQLWVLESEEQLVAMTGFNAAIDEAVQVGGVFTPPELRGKRHARNVVAASLKQARAQGVSLAILFTEEDNAPAQRAYTALGFEAIGDYGLLLLKKAIQPQALS